ncbi:hypothetical protein L1987_13435 [Smallanthus sonchifolius]|uniref:Uncharacterized protein n=1 Tax=Smallanthus sonchifolius TaxID=185202 RepID=A0ACB9JGI2_9ASTR|nr:hypothetical protein L1987_13435 [Smallanthus sonchifolius]
MNTSRIWQRLLQERQRIDDDLFSGEVSLKPEHFEGMRVDFTKGLNQSIVMGPTEVPSQSAETIKIPTANYEFGANFIDPKAHAQLTNEPHMSHGMFNFDYKGTYYRTQFQLGNGGLLGASYIQSVTPYLSLGGEVFWAGQHRKSGLGYAARYNTDKMLLLSPSLLFL